MALGFTCLDDESLRLALLHSQKKWGNQLNITGGDEQFQRRLIEAADKLGIKITSSMQELPVPLQTATKPPMDSMEMLIARLKAEGKTVRVAKDGAPYAGKILEVGEGFAIQDIGKNTCVIHGLRMLGDVVIGQDLRIRYRNGQATVTDRQRETRERGSL